jgi:hypothetical protein
MFLLFVALSGQTLSGPNFIIYIFIFLRSVQKRKVPTSGIYNWSPGLIFDATCTIFRSRADPRAPGARREAQSAENLQKTLGRIYHLILPRVCPIVQGMDNYKLSCRHHGVIQNLCFSTPKSQCKSYDRTNVQSTMQSRTPRRQTVDETQKYLAAPRNLKREQKDTTRKTV